MAGQSGATPVLLITLQIGTALEGDVLLGPARAGILAVVLMAIAVVWAGVWILGLSFSTWLPVAMLCLFMLSMSLPLVVAMSMGLIQVLTPGEMRARLLSLFTMISFGMQPLSALLVGTASERFSVATVASVNGSILVLGGLAMIFLRQGLRQWEVHPTHVAPPAMH